MNDVEDLNSAEAASSLKACSAELFLSEVSNEMHICVRSRETESPSCALHVQVSSSVSQHNHPFSVCHTAACDPHTHNPPNQPIYECGGTLKKRKKEKGCLVVVSVHKDNNRFIQLK